MPVNGATPNPGRAPAFQEDPLVPFLPMEGGAPDPVAISTWHQALVASTSVQIPNDLFALWLYPASGGIVLLGPDTLARETIELPLPEPRLKQDQLFELEQVLRRAKYLSAIAVPVRHESRDVAVALLGSFLRGAFGPQEAAALHRLGERLVPPLSELALVMPSVTPHAAVEPAMTPEELPGHLARAAVEAADGPDLVRRVSGVLYPLLPHDRVEILVVAGDTRLVALSGGAPRRRWSSTGGSVDPFTTIVNRFGPAPTILIDDRDGASEGSEWVVGNRAAGSQPARAVLGARLQVAGQVVGYLLLGSVAGDAYRPDDEDILGLAGLLLSPRVHGLRLQAHLDAREADAPDQSSDALAGSAEALAGRSHLGEALSRFAESLAQVLTHERIAIHLRWGEEDLIELEAGAPRPFADLPRIPLSSFQGAAVIRGDREWLVRSVGGGEEIIVPLQVAGRATGTLSVFGKNFPRTREAALTAHRFANVLAPHLELLRRGAAMTAPVRDLSAFRR